MKKKLLAGAITLLSVATLAACSNSSQGVMFEVPSQENVKTVRITKEAVDGTAKPILETA